MAWFYVLLASVLEIGWALGLKQVQKPGQAWVWAPTIMGMALTYVLLYMAVRTLEIGTAYAVWTGIGAAGTAIMGIILFGESTSALKVVSIVLIVAGIVGLRLASNPRTLSPGSLSHITSALPEQNRSPE